MGLRLWRHDLTQGILKHFSECKLAIHLWLPCLIFLFHMISCSLDGWCGYYLAVRWTVEVVLSWIESITSCDYLVSLSVDAIWRLVFFSSVPFCWFQIVNYRVSNDNVCLLWSRIKVVLVRMYTTIWIQRVCGRRICKELFTRR